MRFVTYEAPYGFYHEPLDHPYIMMRELRKEPDGVDMWVCIDKRALGQIVVEAGTQTRCVQRLVKYLESTSWNPQYEV